MKETRHAPAVFGADPRHNTVFSIHMYGVFDTEPEVRDCMNRFVASGLPVVVGEFGDAHSDGNPDEDAIMGTAQELGPGCLGWSWSGNGGGVEYLDMATGFDASSLTPWGQRLQRPRRHQGDVAPGERLRLNRPPGGGPAPGPPRPAGPLRSSAGASAGSPPGGRPFHRSALLPRRPDRAPARAPQRWEHTRSPEERSA
ncbi:cellulase family glycosylhydrolase [Streptomyces armeniacus]|uniref:cellulase family glycosylhydrolase n=1 Tax=Streptomyces armeniacus TaxID=83291 RepID=UPI0026872166